MILTHVLLAFNLFSQSPTRVGHIQLMPCHSSSPAPKVRTGADLINQPQWGGWVGGGDTATEMHTNTSASSCPSKA